MFKSKNKILIIYCLWLVIFVVIPLVVLAIYGLTSESFHFTLSNIESILDKENIKALLVSLLYSLISTFVCLGIAYPICYFIKYGFVKNKELLVFLLVLPMWLNSVLRLLSLETMLSGSGIVNYVLSYFNLRNISISNHNIKILIGLIYEFLPFMILPIYNSIDKVEDDLINSARDLGASRLYILQKVLIPLTKPGIISGIIMVFIPSLTSFVVPEILGGGKKLLIGNIIEQEFTLYYRWHVGAGLSLVMLIFVVFSFIISSQDSRETIL